MHCGVKVASQSKSLPASCKTCFKRTVFVHAEQLWQIKLGQVGADTEASRLPELREGALHPLKRASAVHVGAVKYARFVLAPKAMTSYSIARDPQEGFRPSVGIALTNSQCNGAGVLTLQRSKEAGIWELPQGGLIGDEDAADAGALRELLIGARKLPVRVTAGCAATQCLLASELSIAQPQTTFSSAISLLHAWIFSCAAAKRELYDATGIPPEAVRLMAVLPKWLHYCYPANVQQQKRQAGRSNWMGQRVVRFRRLDSWRTSVRCCHRGRLCEQPSALHEARLCFNHFVQQDDGH